MKQMAAVYRPRLLPPRNKRRRSCYDLTATQIASLRLREPACCGLHAGCVCANSARFRTC